MGAEFLSFQRSLNASNNDLLRSVASAADQWSTIFGDHVWDFGVGFSVVSVTLMGVFYGYFMAPISRALVSRLILRVILFSSLAIPLTNPFGSLYFHISVLALVFLGFVFNKNGARLA